MTTWDMNTVRAVCRLFVRAEMARDLAAREEELPELWLSAVGAPRFVQEAGERFAVAVHPGDLAVRIVGRSYGTVTVVAWWHPAYRRSLVPIELLGGPVDGQIMAMRPEQVPVGLRIMPPAQHPLWAGPEAEAIGPASPMPQPLLYQVSGWRELERQWLMSPAP